jgi:hypothetical protein
MNDTIRWKTLSFNLGLLPARTRSTVRAARGRSTLSGYVLAPGNKYKMYEIPFSKMSQPRLGATWAYNGATRSTQLRDVQPGGQLRCRAPRHGTATSATTINAHFDANGVLFGTTPVASSSGKLFVDDLTPRHVDEFLLGTAQAVRRHWSAAALRPLPQGQPLLGRHQQ